jgi:hypothetical protein
MLALNNGGTAPGTPIGFNTRRTVALWAFGSLTPDQHRAVYQAFNTLQTYLAGRS